MTNFQRLSAKTSDLHSCIIENTHIHTHTSQSSDARTLKLLLRIRNSRGQPIYWTRSEDRYLEGSQASIGPGSPLIGRASSKRPAGCHTGVKGGAWPLALPFSLPIMEVETAVPVLGFEPAWASIDGLFG